MGAVFSIGVELGHLIPPDARLTAEVFPNLASAVQRITALAHQEWVEYALGKQLPSGMTISNRTGEYARSILFRETGPFSGEVFSHLAYARAIEEGMPERDMKKMLNSSFKVRLTKDGRRYLIIPFEHNRHTGMPDAVRDWFAGKATSHVTGTYRRQSGTGAYDIRTRKLITVPGWRYAWGSKLGKSDLEGMGIGGDAAKRLQGMYKFAHPGPAKGESGPKAGSHSRYVNFRVMMEGSKGWIAKAQPGKYPARTVAEQLRPLAEQVFAAAVEADVRAILSTA